LQKQSENLAQNIDVDIQNIDKSTSKIENKIPKSPSIFVAGIANVTTLTTLLDSIAKNEYDIKVLSNIQIQ